MKRTALFSVAIVALMVVGCQDESVLQPQSTVSLTSAPSSGGGNELEGNGRLLINCIVFLPGSDPITPIAVRGSGIYTVAEDGPSHVRYNLAISAKLTPLGSTNSWRISGNFGGRSRLSEDGTTVVVCNYPVVGLTEVDLIANYLVDSKGELKIQSMQLQRLVDW